MSDPKFACPTCSRSAGPGSPASVSLVPRGIQDVWSMSGVSSKTFLSVQYPENGGILPWSIIPLLAWTVTAFSPSSP